MDTAWILASCRVARGGGKWILEEYEGIGSDFILGWKPIRRMFGSAIDSVMGLCNNRN